jgi:alkylation response protein AidB-like acyl-CoA dehydrogenase
MVTLSNSRTLAAGISTGIARAAFDESLDYVRTRSAFGGKIIDFQGIQWYYADAAAEIDAARLLCYQAARDLDIDGDYVRSSSAAKYVAARLATKVAGMAVQVCGAHGTQVAAPFGRYLRDAKAYEVGGGSGEILKNTIAKQIVKKLDAERPL